MKALQALTIVLIVIIWWGMESVIGVVISQNKSILDNQNTILQAIKNESSINTLSQIKTLLEDNKSLTMDNEYKATYIKEFNEILHEQVNFAGMQKYYMRKEGIK